MYGMNSIPPMGGGGGVGHPSILTFIFDFRSTKASTVENGKLRNTNTHTQTLRKKTVRVGGEGA